MRILVVASRARPFGGGEVMTATLRDALRARGHEVRVLAGKSPLAAGPHDSDYTYPSPDGRATALLQPGNPLARRRLRGALSEFDPDVVHVRGNPARLTPLILPPLGEVPSVFHATGEAAVWTTGSRLLPGAARWRAGRDVFDAVVANSEATRRRLLADGVPDVLVIPNGTPVVEPRPPLASPPTISCASRLEWQKGVDVLLRAFARVRAAVPASRLALAGDGPERAALERLAAELGLGEAVTFHGRLPWREASRRLEGAWVHAVPSRAEEGFGLAAAEAMMRGTCVAASDAGGLRELVDPGRTGALVPPGDPAALADALLRPLRDRALAERLGGAARAHALERFTAERCAERFERLYGELCRPSFTAQRALSL